MMTGTPGRLMRFYGMLPPVANVALIILIAVAVARLTWILVPAPSGRSSLRPIVRGELGGNRLSNPIKVGTAAAENLFINPLADAPQQPIATLETHLKLELSGVLASTDSHLSRAIIQTPGGKEHSFKLGDEIIKGVTLSQVHSHWVVLARAGRYETLYMPRVRRKGLTGANPARSLKPQNLAVLRQQILHQPGKIMQFIRIQPAYRSGKLIGYRLFPGNQRAFFDQVGLRPGDLVTRINDVKLNNPQQSLAVLNDLAKASSVHLTLDRQGQAKQITITLQ